MKYNFLALIFLTLIACATPTPPQTQIPTASMPATFTPTATLIQTLSPTQTPFPTLAPDFCANIRGTELIDSFRKAIQNQDGALLASLVSPSHGMDVLFYRNGNVVNYDVEHAKFVFETAYQADWGLSYGSGAPTKGSFQEIVLPSLQRVFTALSIVTCSQIQTGGVTYFPEFPYTNMNFYSVYYAGGDQSNGFDWETWVVGMDSIDGKLYLAALIHFVWEP